MARAREDQRGGATIVKVKGEVWKIGMLGQRQVKPRWAYDIVRRHDGRRWRECRGRRGITPPEGHRTGGREGRKGK